jgi:hypothetical protein
MKLQKSGYLFIIQNTILPHSQFRDVQRHFNAMSKWVTSTIQTGGAELKQTITFFVDLIMALRNLRNFNGMMIIVSGMRRAESRAMEKVIDDLDGQQKRGFEFANEMMIDPFKFDD